MTAIKLSVCIPYKQRLDNIKLVFEALANQTIQKDEFEVIVGAMEYCDKFITLCQTYSNRFNLTAVCSAKQFDIPRARNLAMKQARGEVIVQIDADTFLPENALENLYNQHFAFEQNICAVGQVVGYDNNNDGPVHRVEVKSYKEYLSALTDLKTSKQTPCDPRFQVEHHIPWAFGWTGFIALPRKLVKQYNLYFDENFQGWGIDDLEWSFRICHSKIPIVLCKDMAALHLPHLRDPEANRKTETQNYQHFLKKWPRYDVELSYTFGDVKANDLYVNFMGVLKLSKSSHDKEPRCISGKVHNKNIIIVGLTSTSPETLLSGWQTTEELPLLGMALPFQDKKFDECYLAPFIFNLPEIYQVPVKREAERLALKVLSMEKITATAH